MILYLLLGALVVAAVLPSFAAPLSLLRLLRFLFVFAIYPLFIAIGATLGMKAAAVSWLALTGVTFLLELLADRLVPTQKYPASWGTAAWKTALLWPLVLPAVVEALLVHLGLAPQQPEIHLPEPPRGAELFMLPDDELLVAVYQILAGHAELVPEEQTVWLAETFSREVHGGGLLQWLYNTEHSPPDTVDALRAVGATTAAGILQQAAEALPRTWDVQQPLELRQRALREVEPALRSLDAQFFSPEHREDLTSLVARFVRQNRSRCPVLQGAPHEGT